MWNYISKAFRPRPIAMKITVFTTPRIHPKVFTTRRREVRAQSAFPHYDKGNVNVTLHITNLHVYLIQLRWIFFDGVRSCDLVNAQTWGGITPKKMKSISHHWSNGSRFTHGLFLVTSYIIFLGWFPSTDIEMHQLLSYPFSSTTFFSPWFVHSHTRHSEQIYLSTEWWTEIRTNDKLWMKYYALIMERSSQWC